PDLPGCMTQAETVDEIGPMADAARRIWIETAYDEDRDIPLPSYPEQYSGKFVVRVPRSLHRQLAEAAAREGVSLNQYVVMLLARGDAHAGLQRWLDDQDRRSRAVPHSMRYQVHGVPTLRAPRGLAPVRLLEEEAVVA